MKRLVLCGGAMAVVLIAACQDTGTSPSAGDLTIPSAFSATTYGFSNVSSLKKDDKGVWRGTAMRDGKSVDVSLDFEGNVVAR